MDAALAAFDRKFATVAAQAPKEPADPADKAWIAAKIRQMTKLDQLVRDDGLSMENRFQGDAGRYFSRRFFPRYADPVDADNAAEMKRLIGSSGWFKISDWGKEIDDDAWLLVQHMDQDLPFQKLVLAMLEKLYPSGETSAAHYAYLYDRVAWHEDRLQRYGTQGRCAAAGRWEPKPLEDPDHLDQRRKSMGLEPEAAEKRRLSLLCDGQD